MGNGIIQIRKKLRISVIFNAFLFLENAKNRINKRSIIGEDWIRSYIPNNLGTSFDY